MTGRRKLSTVDKLHIVVAQAACPLCSKKLGPLADLDFDHEIALALGGADAIDNLRAVHRDCHKVKTFGRGATTAGSDIGEAARLKRLEKNEAERRRAMLAKEPGKPRPKSSRWGKRSFGRKARRAPAQQAAE